MSKIRPPKHLRPATKRWSGTIAWRRDRLAVANSRPVEPRVDLERGRARPIGDDTAGAGRDDPEAAGEGEVRRWATTLLFNKPGGKP